MPTTTRPRLAMCLALVLMLSSCAFETGPEGQATVWNVPLAVDVGTFAGLFLGSALLGEVLRRFRERQRRDAIAERDRKKAAQERAEADARAAEKAYHTHKEALEIHESVTSREVFEALQSAQPGAPEHQYLLATYRRGRSRYLAFSNQSGDLDAELEALVTSALDDIARRFPADLAEEQAAVLDKQERRAGDRTRYRVGAYGELSKHHTLHVIEKRFCERESITSREDFTERFGAIVVEVVGARIGNASFTGATLLHDPSAASEAHQRRYRDRELAAMAELGAIRLDEVDHLAGWKVGFDRMVPDIGRRVHQPLIQHFMGREGYEDITAQE